jgi:hypothetical protein
MPRLNKEENNNNLLNTITTNILLLGLGSSVALIKN